MRRVRRVKIAALKSNLSRYLAHVRAGDTVVVLDRDRPVAKIVPLEPADVRAGDDERLAELERLGLIRRGNPAGVRAWLKTHRPVKLTGGGSLVAICSRNDGAAGEVLGQPGADAALRHRAVDRDRPALVRR